MKYLERFKDLPKFFWFSFVGLSSIAGFFVWGVRPDFEYHHRLLIIVLLIVIDLLIVLAIIIFRPSTRETLLIARLLTRAARDDFNERNYHTALEKLEKAIKIDKNNISTWGLLGRTLLYLGKLDESILPLSEAIELSNIDGNRHIHLINRSICYFYKKEYGKSLDDIELVLKDDPEHEDALRIRASIWIEEN
jgi:tetratricopeptide (TPR) repeat protein